MPPRDPAKIQLDFPQLTADLINQLNLIGTVGLLDFAPTVLPVFIVGDRDLQVEAVPPLYLPAEIFSGDATNPAASTIIVDTGQLLAGDFDVQLHANVGITTGGPRGLLIEHRNAANDAALHRWFCFAANGSTAVVNVVCALRFAANERIRVITDAALTAAKVGATIMVARRPVP